MSRGSTRRALCAIPLLLSLLLIKAPAGSRENEGPLTPRKERGADLYMLNYNRYIEHGFYLSVSGKAARYRDGWGALAGGRAVLLVDHIFAIGAACELSLYHAPGAIEPGRFHSLFGNAPGRIKILYGGGYISYHIFHDRIVNFSLGSIAGWGWLGGDYARGPGTRFFLIEPEIYVFVNLPGYARIGAGASYRLSWGVDYLGIRDRHFRGFSIGVQLQAGIL